MAKSAQTIDKMSFEKALEELETTVEKMEEGEVPLEKLVEQFEHGSALLNHCSKRLKDAELKIEKLTSKPDEQAKFEDFDA